MNIVVLQGALSREPDVRELASGDVVVSYELTVAREGEKSETVPVACEPAAAGSAAATKAANLAAREEVVVVGRVRRRFFRAGASTQSRTEVVAAEVVPAKSTKRVNALLARAAEAIDEGGAS